MKRSPALFGLVCAAWVLIAPAQTTVPTTGLITPQAKADQAKLCAPGKARYPTQFTWAPGHIKVPARDATPADHLTPRIEQHRVIKGKDTVIAVWKSFSSNPYTCSEPFQAPPTDPAPSPPYTVADREPYTPAMLKKIAATGCGPFGNTSHVDLFRLWLPEDRFLVYPAVYTGTTYQGQTVSNNNITLHPQPDYYSGTGNPIYPPNDITIEGVTEHGIRPVIIRNDGGGGDSETAKDVVEIEGGANDTIRNIGITLGPASSAYVLQAGLYLIHAGYNDYDANGNPLAVPVLGAAPNRTLIAQTHIWGFEAIEPISGGANGVTGDPTGGGEVEFLENEINHNGGSGVQNSGGIGHGIYMDASNTAFGTPTYDPDYHVVFEGNWFHDQYFGHDAKSRAQYTTLLANYFQGGLPQGGIYAQAEAFNADIPNGGVLTAIDNIFVKTASGTNSAGFGTAYGEEGFPTAPYDGPKGGPRRNGIDIEFNTYVTFAATFDGTHANVPFEFFYPAKRPGRAGFPVADITVASNAFVGYCPQGNAITDYRGTTDLIAGFADLEETFSFGGKYRSSNAAVIGRPDYAHAVSVGKRVGQSVGGED
jgi:hypothetical protein